MPKARIHSIETLATLDGPGLRTVIFMQGCPLKCKYCHNVDLTLYDGGELYSVDEIFKKVIKNKSYWKVDSADDQVHGGVTISGGEPTVQTHFLTHLIPKFRDQKVHIAMDSCLYTSQTNIDLLAPLVDLWMISIKEFDTHKHSDLTGVKNELIISNLNHLDAYITKHNLKSKIRIRYVIIPGVTDSREYIHNLGKLALTIKNLEFLELLPYTSLGKHKWIELFESYELEGIPDATTTNIDKVKQALSSIGIELK